MILEDKADKRGRIFEIFDRLYKAFGAQGWWPITAPGETVPKYHPTNSTRLLSYKEKLEIIIGCILTQNASWQSNVLPALKNLHEKGLINLEALNKIEIEQLAEIIKSAGYRFQKAKRLKKIVRFLSQNSLDELFSLPVNQLRGRLLSLNGVGPETADSIILYAARKPIFVIDKYTQRIFYRLGYDEMESGRGRGTACRVSTLFISNLPDDPELFGEYHALIVELAKRHCRKIPICDGCPLYDVCKKRIAEF
jgi:endonuclease-3 related protein